MKRILFIWILFFLVVVSFVWTASQMQQQQQELQQQRRNSQLDTTAATATLASGITQQSYTPLPAVLYRWQPSQVVQTIADCLLDSSCHILHHHLLKAGGSTVNAVFYRWTGLPPKRDCCYADRTRKVLSAESPAVYCDLPYVSHEVIGREFLQIVQYCLNYYSQQETQRRLVVLKTIREPTAWTFSRIQHRCNKFPERRDAATLAACQRCNYQQDGAFWNPFLITAGNLHYQQSFQVLQQAPYMVPTTHNNHTALSSNHPVPIQVVALDTEDLSDFFRDMEQYNGTQFRQSIGHNKNTESKTVCDFAFTSVVLKGLAQSAQLYRQFTMGNVFVQKQKQETPMNLISAQEEEEEEDDNNKWDWTEQDWLDEVQSLEAGE